MPRPDLASRFTRVPRWAWFALALALQVAIIGSMVVSHYATAATGTPVLLKIAPVDPRDPLRGDYLTFTYDISVLDPQTFVAQSGPGTWTPTVGETVYVPLSRQGTYWVAQYGVAKKLPGTRGPGDTQGPYPTDSVLLRGAVKSVDSAGIHVTYGIEEFFIPEGKGTRLPWNKETSALVVVGRDGRGQIRQVFVDGRKWP